MPTSCRYDSAHGLICSAHGMALQDSVILPEVRRFGSRDKAGKKETVVQLWSCRQRSLIACNQTLVPDRSSPVKFPVQSGDMRLEESGQTSCAIGWPAVAQQPQRECSTKHWARTSAMLYERCRERSFAEGFLPAATPEFLAFASSDGACLVCKLQEQEDARLARQLAGESGGRLGLSRGRPPQQEATWAAAHEPSPRTQARALALLLSPPDPC